METKRPSRLPLLASVVVLVILAAALGYVYVTSSQTISSNNSTITSQQSQIAGQSATIASQSGVISSQSATIQSQSATVSSQAGSIAVLQANVSAYKNVVSALNNVISSDKTELTTLNATIGTDETTIATDSSNIDALHAQITLAESIESNYSEIITLSYSKSLVSNLNVTIYGTTHNSTKPFVTFSPDYAGYVYISVSNFTASGYILNSTAKPTNLNLNGVYEQWTLLAPTSSPDVSYFVVPVSPGTMNTFALFGFSATDGTAIVSATYYY